MHAAYAGLFDQEAGQVVGRGVVGHGRSGVNAGVGFHG